MNYGFLKVAAAVPTVRVADCEYNCNQIEQLILQAETQGVEIVVFPELSITGYTCQDLFRQSQLLSSSEAAVARLVRFSVDKDVIVIVGAPVPAGDLLLNAAIVFQKGKLLGIVPKTYLPNYAEFYEKRWFASSQDLRPTPVNYAGEQLIVHSDPMLFTTAEGVRFGIEICEDVWAPTPPSNHLALAGADLIFNLSASDELIGKHAYLESLLSQQSARTISGYVYSGCGLGESTQDVVYGGNAIIYENGQLLAEGKRFSMDPYLQTAQIDIERLRTERRTNTTFVNAQRRMLSESVCTIHCESVHNHPFKLERHFDPLPFVPTDEKRDSTCEDIFTIQAMGLVKRLQHTHSSKVVLGISGGLDSTLALLVCVRAFQLLGLDRKGIYGVTMPGFGTTDRTYHNAIHLMESLGVSIREISIAKSVTQHFEDIGHDIHVHDVTYENGQARERTQILMDLSNQVGGLVVGTGDLSEWALGWATYNGDHMSMYGVNSSIPKTLIKTLVAYAASQLDATSKAILLDIIDTPISPELIPADDNGNIQQKAEDLGGPYELHDFFLYYFLLLGFSPRKIFLMAKNAFDHPDRAFASHHDGDEIKTWLLTFLRRFFAQQFKRSCLPDGPKVGSVSLSPRGDWRMPSDAMSTQWLKEAEVM